MSQLSRLPLGRPPAVEAQSAEPHSRTLVEEAWHRHGVAVFALALVLFDDTEEAEAIVAQAFLDACTPAEIAVESVSRHDMARYVYVLWLRRMAQPGVARAQLRARWKPARTTGMPALRRLSHLQRTAIALALFGEHTYREIATLMELPPQDVADLMRSGLLAATDA